MSRFNLHFEDPNPALITQGVPVASQTMAADKSFWIFFTPGFTISTWVLGVLIAQNLSTGYALLAIALGNLVATIPTAIIARLGPRLRLTQIEASRFALGTHGVKIPGFLNWFSSIGWDAVNNVPAAAALVALALIAGTSIPFWEALVGLVLVQTLIAIFGHDLTQAMAKLLAFVMPVLFAGLGVRALIDGAGTVVVPSEFSWHAFLVSSTLVVIGSTSWLAYASDYTRYLPPTTKSSSLFWRVYLGIGLSLGSMEVFGACSSSLTHSTTTAGITASLQHLAGPFAPLVLVIVALSSVPANAINDNSAAYCLVTSGIRLKRPVSVALGAAIGFALALYGAERILPLIANVMMLMLYWLMAWGGIVLVQTLSPTLTAASPSKWPRAATIFVGVTAISTLLFASNALYTGPIAKLLGGADIGFYVAFLVSALLYRFTLQHPKAEADRLLPP